MLEEQAIRNLAVQEVIYQDLTHRAGEGEILGKQEQAFMQNHPENMKKHGLYTDKSGKLQQRTNVRVWREFFPPHVLISLYP